MNFNKNVAKLFPDKVQEFHDRFGDSFVSRITRGGHYFFVLNIETSSATEQQEITADIKASGGVWSAAAQFKQAVSSATSSHRTTLTYSVVGTKESPQPKEGGDLTLDDLLKFADDFVNKVYKETNEDNQLLFTLTPYADLPNYPGEPSKPLGPAQVAINQLAGLYDDYARLLNSVDHIQKNPLEFEKPSVDLDDLRTKIQGPEREGGYMRQIKDAAQSDAVIPPPEPPEDPTTLRLPAVKSLEDKLPQRIKNLPQTAKDLRKLFLDSGTTPIDGEYDLFLGGQWQKRMTLFCAKMSTDTPVEYLTLHGANVSSFPASYRDEPTDTNKVDWKYGYSFGTDVTTAFQKVRIDPKTLQIDLQDFTYAQSNGSIARYQYDESRPKKLTAKPVRRISHVPFAIAENSTANSSQLKPKDKPGRATIDLTDTGFQIDPSVQWLESGSSAGGKVVKQTPLTVEVQGWGSGGGMFPNGSSTKLQLALFNPSS
jgi:hypothetical protein